MIPCTRLLILWGLNPGNDDLIKIKDDLIKIKKIKKHIFEFSRSIIPVFPLLFSPLVR